MDPKIHQKAQSIAQSETRKLVDRVVSDNLRGVTTFTPVEIAIVKAIYNPDRRLG